MNSGTVVSMPSTTVFDRQDAGYRKAVLGTDIPRLAVEHAPGPVVIAGTPVNGALVAFAVALVAVGIGVAAGVPLGLVAAAGRGGWVDDVIMRGNDLIFAFPSLVIAILITAALGPSAANAMIAIGIFNIPVFARVTRAAALPIEVKVWVIGRRKP